ncbi:MAG TPA: aminotransferase class I/II-fold pyridoxal phosphate-dependent enzyme [Gemmatimonadaceae bacterium]|jgi:aspartate/methionine/tyrosine aminotransferase
MTATMPQTSGLHASTKPSISKRTFDLGTENAFVVLAEVMELKRQGKDIVMFSVGQPDFHTPPHVADAAIAAIHAGKDGYTAAPGLPELRAVVAKSMGEFRNLPIRSEDVVIASGAKPFMAYAIHSTTDYGAGDEVIVPVPGFPIYASQTAASGAVPVPLYLRESRDFAFDPNDLEAAITPKTKLLILNSPHNPTGGLLSKQNLEDIASILRKNPQIWIYSDEIYSRLTYDESYTSIASMPDMYERTIIADGASKAWAMTGWRIGFASNPILAPHFGRWIINTESCASQISQWAAVEAIGGPQDTTIAMKNEFHARRDLIVKLLNEVPGVTCRMPGGAFYAWPNVTEACRMVGAENSEALRKRLLHEAGVAVLSDTHFGAKVPGDGEHVRFSYAASREMITEGVGRMRDFIVRNKI